MRPVLRPSIDTAVLLLEAKVQRRSRHDRWITVMDESLTHARSKTPVGRQGWSCGVGRFPVRGGKARTYRSARATASRSHQRIAVAGSTTMGTEWIRAANIAAGRST